MSPGSKVGHLRQVAGSTMYYGHSTVVQCVARLLVECLFLFVARLSFSSIFSFSSLPSRFFSFSFSFLFFFSFHFFPFHFISYLFIIFTPLIILYSHMTVVHLHALHSITQHTCLSSCSAVASHLEMPLRLFPRCSHTLHELSTAIAQRMLFLSASPFVVFLSFRSSALLACPDQ